MSDLIKKLNTQEFETEVEQGSGLVLVDFWAPWCGPCLRIAPVLEELASEYQGRVKIMKVNVDENRPVAEKFQITGIPTMILFKDGQKVDQSVGASPKAQIKEFLASHL